jgi:hypothetical protein
MRSWIKNMSLQDALETIDSLVNIIENAQRSKRPRKNYLHDAVNLNTDIDLSNIKFISKKEYLNLKENYCKK